MQTSSDRLRILFCITDLDVGGAEQALVEIATRIAARGHICRVISLAPPPPAERARLEVQLRAAEIDVSFLHAAAVRHAPRTVSRLAGDLRAFAPHVVQSFLHHANVLAALAVRRAGRPPLVTGIRVAERRRNLHAWLARRTDSLVARHVCVSRAVADFVAREIGLPPEKLVVIPNGVDISKFENAEPLPHKALGVPPDGRVIAYLGRLDRQKRLDWLLNRMPAITDRLPEHHLVLVGEGPEHDPLQASVQRLGIEQRVHFVGWRNDIPSVLGAADMLLLTSEWEGLPNVLLEAMAAGRPIVTTGAEGVDELLTDGREEQIVALDDEAGFIARVVRLGTDPALAARLGAANQQRARLFSWEAAAAAYERLYDLTARRIS